MAHDVFLSHSHVDKVFADAICHKLEADGIRCWVAPRDIRPAEDWAESIINAMEAAKVLVLVFSSASNSSPQVRREVERAVNKGLHVLPFRIENVPLSKSLEYFISTQHWLDAIDGRLDFHLEQLRSCIVPLLQTAPADLAGAAAPAVAAAVAPAPTGMPAATLAPDALARIETALGRHVGPIARPLVRRHAANAVSVGGLAATLALELDNEQERKQFLASLHGL
jgi:hypothetical protein